MSDDALSLSLENGDVFTDAEFPHECVTERLPHNGAVVRFGNRELVVFANAVGVDLAVREHWTTLRADDPTAFRALVTEDTLIEWGLGQGSFESWLDDVADDATSVFGTFDGHEHTAEAVSPALVEELGFKPEYVYRRG